MNAMVHDKMASPVPAWSHPRSEAVPAPCSPQALLAAHLELNSALDAPSLSAEFAEEGRIRLSGLLACGALELYDHLQQSPDWVHLITTEDDVLELEGDARNRLSAAELTALGSEAQLRSRDTFQYRYEAIRVPDPAEAAADRDLIDRFALLMASPEMRELLGSIVGEEVGGFTDGQATAYGPEDFLTLHDDAVEGKDRLAAFVYGLTPGWRVDWGGLLLFHGDRDHSAYALAPRFNTLDLFAVPRAHSVSLVSRAAAHRRYAITGWLTRARK